MEWIEAILPSWLRDGIPIHDVGLLAGMGQSWSIRAA
jgi:hypothetical protein